MTQKLGSKALLLAALFGLACSSNADDGPKKAEDCETRLESAEGALVDVNVTSRVGVVLDEVPETERAKLVSFYLKQPASFWIERAKHQLRHTTYRLTYRNFYYDESEQRNMLALPPEEVWQITLDGKPKRVTTEDGHDVIEVGYEYQSTIVTDAASPGASEPALADVGGVWSETFNFPLDPEFLFQRTGYACANEDGYPLGTVESENVYEMFDQDCEVETEDTASCHLTNLPQESCLDALAAHVGRVDTELRFERVPFNPAKACAAQVGEFTSTDNPDLAVMPERLDNNWVEYRYFPADSCALVEQCVGGTGWRRLLLFDATIKNTGAAALSVGTTEVGSPPSEHNMFELSECHGHHHFRHYGDFSYGDLPGDKRAFCIESTDRQYNNVGTPLVHEFGCENQGIAPGWGDTYIAGVECNWIDITDLDIPEAGLTQELKFVLNPDDFICEGQPRLSGNGEPLYESTEFVTETGLPVDRPVCDFVADYRSNNVGKRPVLLPSEGSLVTAACQRDQRGPLRDCGFQKHSDRKKCDAGSEVRLSCSIPEGDASHVLRVCDDSRKLGGIPCMFQHALANEVVGSDGASISFVCPEARDADEPGGTYSMYVAAVNATEPGTTVTCTQE